MIDLTLYGRRGCHLCDEMVAELVRLQGELPFRLVQVDVDDDPALATRYGRLVPVLERDGVEVCHYFLDEARLRACFG